MSHTLNPNRWPSLKIFVSFLLWAINCFSCSSKSKAAPGSGKRGGGATQAASNAATVTGVPVLTITRELPSPTILDVASFIICCNRAPGIPITLFVKTKSVFLSI